MTPRHQLRLNGELYTWTGTHWHDRMYVKPPQVIVQELNRLLDAALVDDDDGVTDRQELMDRARAARENGQHERSVRLSHRLLDLNRHDHGAASMLCAALRAAHRPAEAIAETNRFLPTDNGPLLTSRAAAFCDLGRWEEARRSVGRALAISGGNEEAFMVVKRIKQSRPDLYGG